MAKADLDDPARFVDCKRCFYGAEGSGTSWITRKKLPDQPVRCARCRSPYWFLEPRSGMTIKDKAK